MKYSRKSGRSSVNKTRKNKSSSNIAKKHMITYMLQMLMTVKLYHWNTLSFSTHKATDELYGTLNTLIDQFVEVLLGKHNNVSERNKHEILTIKTLHLHSYKDNGKFKQQLEMYKKYLVGLSKHFSNGENTDLLNIRDEILATLNKISYLLTLK
jgi:DNA-binding ferritin-like protein